MPYANGQLIIQPQARVSVVSGGSAPLGAASNRTLWLLGDSVDGQPQQSYVLSSPADAFNIFKDGALVQGAVLAFQGTSVTPPPASITAIRVGNTTGTTQATAYVLGASNAHEILLTSTSWGTIANLTKFQVTAASGGIGYLVKVGSDYSGPQTTPTVVSQDNLYLPVLTLLYTGTGTSPNVSVTDTAITLTATTSDTGGTISFTSTMTVSNLVAQINTLAGWQAAVADPNANDLVLPGGAIPALMDNVSAVAVPTTGTPLTLYGNIAAVVRWLNSGAQPFVTATRQAGATSITAMTAYSYLSGGTYTAPTSTDWQTVLNNLENVDGMGVVVPVKDAFDSMNVGSMVESHVNYMSGVGQYRLGVVGPAAGKTLAQVQADAATLNSSRMILRWPGFVATNIYGNTATLDPFYEACRTGAAIVAAPAYRSLTLQPVIANALETAISRANVDTAILSGITITKPYGATFVIAKGVSTWTGSTQFDMVNPSTLSCEDQVAYDLKYALQQGLIGYASPGGPLAVQAAYSIIERTLKDEAALGVLTGNASNPPYQNIQVSISGDTITASAEIHPAQATDYAIVTLTATPFQG